MLLQYLKHTSVNMSLLRVSSHQMCIELETVSEVSFIRSPSSSNALKVSLLYQHEIFYREVSLQAPNYS